jgi:predicted Zn finger-like uncharacterized protein
MFHQATCPHCHADYELTEEYSGKSVRCTTCQQVFRVEFVSPNDSWQPDFRTPVPENEQPIVAELHEEATPAKKDEDEIIDIREALAEPPRPRSRRRDDDERRDKRRFNDGDKDKDDKEPTAAKKQNKTLIGSIAGGILVIALIALKIWAIVGRDRNPPVANNPPPFIANNNFPNGIPPGKFPKVIVPNGGIPNFNLPKVENPQARVLLPARPIEIAPVIAQEMKPSAIQGDREERELPGRIEDVCVGGGGRFLLFKLLDERKLAIFDVVEAKVIKIVATSSANAKIAAGMNKWVVLDPETRMLQSYSFKTLEPEKVVKVEADAAPAVMAMGSGSNGPLVISSIQLGAKNETNILDPDTLTSFGTFDLGQFARLSEPRLNASANGTMFVFESMPMQTIVIKDRVIDRLVGGGTLPAPDASRVFGQAGLYNDKQQPVTIVPTNQANPVWFVPGVEGKCYLAVSGKSARGADQKSIQVAIHLDDPRKPLAARTDVTGLEGVVGLDGSALTPPLQKHLFLIPDAKVLAVVPASKDRVILHRWDVDAALAKAADAAPFVTSRPTRPAVQGQRFSYQIKISAASDELDFRKLEGPPGSAVNPTGLVTWQVPADYPEKEAHFRVSIFAVDLAQKITYDFRVPVFAKDDPTLQPIQKAEESWMNPKNGPRKEESEFGIKPAQPGKEQNRIKFESPFDDFTIAGGGRFFIFHFARDSQLGIFDVNELKLAKSIKLESNKVLFAGGKDQLVVVYPEQSRIERFNLKTFEKELAQQVEYSDIIAVAMGHASNELILAHPAGNALLTSEIVVLDEQLKKRASTMRPGVVPKPNMLRVSANGRHFTVLDRKEGLGLIDANHVDSGDNLSYSMGGMGSPATPSPDGKIVYSSFGFNQFTLQLKNLGLFNGLHYEGRALVPAVHGRYYLAIDGGPQMTRQNVKRPAKVTVSRQGSIKTLAALPPNIFTLEDRPGILADRCIHFIPDAKLVIVFNRNLDTLELTPFDLLAEMEKAGLSTLAATSNPPTEATRGKKYQYRLTANSNKDGIKARIALGPKGMKLSEDGQVEWDVPANARESEYDVSIQMTDASGAEVYHNFTVKLK